MFGSWESEVQMRPIFSSKIRKLLILKDKNKKSPSIRCVIHTASAVNDAFQAMLADQKASKAETRVFFFEKVRS